MSVLPNILHSLSKHSVVYKLKDDLLKIIFSFYSELCVHIYAGVDLGYVMSTTLSDIFFYKIINETLKTLLVVDD